MLLHWKRKELAIRTSRKRIFLIAIWLVLGKRLDDSLDLILGRGNLKIIRDR